MRCLVTGASGHLGAALVARLLAAGAEVVALVRRESDLWRLAGVRERITLLYGDLGDLAAARPALLDARPDVTFHLGWWGVTAAHYHSAQQITRNVPGTLALWDAVQAAGCRVWVGVGSQAEYGVVDGILTEDLPLNPVTAYGAAKVAAAQLTERLCALADMRFLWLRLLATYGPGEDEKRLIPSVIRALLRGERPALTAGEQRWDYLYVDDAADALCRAGLTEGVRGTFNLCSGEAYPVRAIVERLRDLIDPALPLGLGDLPYRPGQPMLLHGDNARLCAALGWRPAVALDAGLARTIAWYRDTP